MAEEGRGPIPARIPSTPRMTTEAGALLPPVDAELDARRIALFGVGLALTVAVILGAVWVLAVGLKKGQLARDPRRSPLVEANRPAFPPDPRLQIAPNLDMDKLRAREDSLLDVYAWVDRKGGVARIPIERAMDILAESGLPEAPQVAGSGHEQGSSPAADATGLAPESTGHDGRGEGIHSSGRGSKGHAQESHTKRTGEREEQSGAGPRPRTGHDHAGGTQRSSKPSGESFPDPAGEGNERRSGGRNEGGIRP